MIALVVSPVYACDWLNISYINQHPKCVGLRLSQELKMSETAVLILNLIACNNFPNLS